MNETKFHEFMTNHWPHMVAEVAKIRGRQDVIAMGLLAIITMVGVLIGLVVNGK